MPRRRVTSYINVTGSQYSGLYWRKLDMFKTENKGTMCVNYNTDGHTEVYLLK